MNREITKLQFLVLYVSVSIFLLVFEGVAHRDVVLAAAGERVSPIWVGPILLVILFVLFLPWFLKLPSGWKK